MRKQRRQHRQACATVLDVRIEKRGRFHVAVPKRPLPPLTHEMVE